MVKINKVLVKHKIFGIVFIIYLCVGLFCFKHYGISYDEPINRINAIVTTNYLMKTFGISKSKEYNSQAPDLHQWKDRDYGVFFELPLLVFEKILKLNSHEKAQQLYWMRHLLTYLMFSISVIFLYLTAFRITANQILSTLAAIFFILSPRIFAESFYNGKDIICMAFFVITTFYLIRFIELPSLKEAFYLGIFSAISINTRLTAILIPAVAGLWLVIAFLQQEQSRIYLLKVAGFFILVTITFTILFWPYLWEAPLHNFIYAFQSMSRFARFNGLVLFMGERVQASQLPWYYIIGYMVFTIPILYWLLFVIGFSGILYHLITSFKDFFSKKNKIYITFLILFFAPLLAIILFDSITYDGWRQLYFVYGAFILIGLIGLQAIWIPAINGANILAKWSFYGIIFAFTLTTAFWMVQNHPHQNVYFNFLAGNNIEKDFDRDYWGLSYKQALEYIAKNDKRSTITVIANSGPGRFNHFMLNTKDKKRFIVGDISPYRRVQEDSLLTCDYFITEYRVVPDPKPFYKKLYAIKVDNFEIIGIYDGKKQIPSRK